MSFKEIKKALEISIFGIGWSYLRHGGLKGVIIYLAEKVLSKVCDVAPANLKTYAAIGLAAAELIRVLVEAFASDSNKTRGYALVDAMKTMCVHCDDGEYTSDESAADINGVKACLDAWSKA